MKIAWLGLFCFIFLLHWPLIGQQTTDGGYVIGGISTSYTHGGHDFLVYRLDAAGNKQWRKNYGGISSDSCYVALQTADGGFILVGYSMSYSNGSVDFLAYKVDASGMKQWRKNYGGTDYDNCQAARPTADGGYILAGYGTSYSAEPGSHDFLIYKVDSAGAKEWRKNYGGLDYDACYSVQQTGDGGYVAAGLSYSYYHGPDGDCDMLIYKLNGAGQKQWRKNYGGIEGDFGRCVWPTSDGGFLLAGYSESYSVEDNFLVYKLDAAGNKQWRKDYGGAEDDRCYAVLQTADGGCLLAGGSRTYSNGSRDFLVYKVDAAGVKQWRKNYGGAAWDCCYTAQQTTDGGYILIGTTYSFTHGGTDFLVYKVDAAGKKEWRKNYGGVFSDYIFAYK